MNKIKRKKNFGLLADTFLIIIVVVIGYAAIIAFVCVSQKHLRGEGIRFHAHFCLHPGMRLLPQSTHTIRLKVIDWLTLPPSHRVVITMWTTMRERTDVGAMPAWILTTVSPSTPRCLLRCVWPACNLYVYYMRWASLRGPPCSPGLMQSATACPATQLPTKTHATYLFVICMCFLLVHLFIGG